MKKRLIFWLFAFISVLAIFWVYREIPTGHFNWEDTMFLGDAAKVWTEGNLKYVFTPWIKKYVRYSRQPFFVIFYRLFGFNSGPYYAFVLMLRLLNVFLIYVLAHRLIKSKIISCLAAIFYGIYQINFQELMWLSSGTKEEPMVTFFLLSLLTFINFFDTGKRGWLFWSYLFFFICFHCEFKAFSAPLVMIAYEFIYQMSRKKFLKFSWVLKYLPFFLLELYFFRFVYNDSAGIFNGIKNRSFLLTFPASLPLYVFEIERLSVWKIATQTWGFNPQQTDEVFLIYLGSIILILLLLFTITLKLVKGKQRDDRFKAMTFFLSGTFFCYLPVILMVAGNQYSIERVVAVHWRYACLASSMACVLVSSFIFWLVEKILWELKYFNRSDSELEFVLNFPVLQLALCLVLMFYHYRMDMRMLEEYLLSSKQAKTFFYSLKEAYPSFSKETVLAIEGAEEEGSPNLFQNRFLFENIFAMYAQPNNPDYLREQQSMPFDGNEAFNRKQLTLLYYTNLKYLIVGNHQFMYDPKENISWSKPNLPFILPTYDREFLGAVYGFFDPQKFVVIHIFSDGTFDDLTKTRRTQLQKLVNYYCFKSGKKTCRENVSPYLIDREIKEIYQGFSPKGREIFDKLISLPPGPLPDLYGLKI